MAIMITFKENKACMTQDIYGNININPKFITKFGIIEVYNNDDGEAIARPFNFEFDAKGGNVSGIEYVRKMELDK